MSSSDKIIYNTKVHVFVDVTSCRPLKIYRRSGSYLCLLLQGRIVQEETFVALEALHILWLRHNRLFTLTNLLLVSVCGRLCVYLVTYRGEVIP